MSKRIVLIGVVAVLAMACGGGDEDQQVEAETTVTMTQPASLVTSTTRSVSETSSSIPAGEPDTSDTGRGTTDITQVTAPDIAAAPTTTAVVAEGTDLSGDFTMTLRSVGAVRLGMSVEEAAQVSTLALTQDFGRLSTDTCYFVTAPSQLPGVSFMVVEGEIVRIEVNPPSAVATRSGARIGTSRESLSVVYADNLRHAPEGVYEGEALAFVPNDEDDADYRIYFSIEDGVVSSYRVGSRPAVDDLSGCTG